MFGFASPLQHRLAPGAQSAALAMQQSAQPDITAAQQQKPLALPPLAPAKPAPGQATMMPDTTLPPLVSPTVPTGTGIEDPSAALPSGSMGALNSAGGDGMEIGDLIAELFG